MLKRFLDIVASLIALAVLSPLFLFLALLVRLRLGSPVLFSQLRPGLWGRPFMMLKFRTMTSERGADGELLPDERRLTGLGRWLRQTSLDELPELWNVLVGDMSLVGPRPLLMQYLERYTPRQARRHEVRPGITGWAQVNGRNAITWEEKFELDVWYVDKHSMALDFKILWMTMVAVLSGRGVAAPGHATAPEFTGSPAANEDERLRSRSVHSVDFSASACSDAAPARTGREYDR